LFVYILSNIHCIKFLKIPSKLTAQPIVCSFIPANVMNFDPQCKRTSHCFYLSFKTATLFSILGSEKDL